MAPASLLEFLEHSVSLDAGSDDDDTGRCEPPARQSDRLSRFGAPEFLDWQRLPADSANEREACSPAPINRRVRAGEVRTRATVSWCLEGGARADVQRLGQCQEWRVSYGHHRASV